MRSELHIRDLKTRTRGPARVMNLKVPAPLWDAIERLRDQLGATKSEIVLALLNAGLEIARSKNLGKR